MPEISAVQTNAAHGAIARASVATGVDFDYLLAQARIESGLDANARATGSSAAGLYQFVGGTWLDTLDRHGSRHGLGRVSDAIERAEGRAVVANPQDRAQILAMRFDPEVSALMAAELARDNGAELENFLGRQPDHAELYLAHFLGAGGARTFLAALRDTPSASAAGLMPEAAGANRAIFFDAARSRSVAEVMDLIRAKISSAEGGETNSFVQAGFIPSGSLAAGSAQGQGYSDEAPPMRPVSMAETLAATFAVGSGNADTLGGRQVGAAYAKLKAFGL